MTRCHLIAAVAVPDPVSRGGACDALFSELSALIATYTNAMRLHGVCS